MRATWKKNITLNKSRNPHQRPRLLSCSTCIGLKTFWDHNLTKNLITKNSAKQKIPWKYRISNFQFQVVCSLICFLSLLPSPSPRIRGPASAVALSSRSGLGSDSSIPGLVQRTRHDRGSVCCGRNFVESCGFGFEGVPKYGLLMMKNWEQW